MPALGADVQEFVLAGALPLTADAAVTDLIQTAPSAPRALRPIRRYRDLAHLVDAWERCFEAVLAWRPDVVWINPCRLLQSPAVPRGFDVPVLYFCDEPRRVDYEAAARRSTNPWTRLPYLPMRRWERRVDRRTVARADRVLTNSRWTADRIRDAYGVTAVPVPLGAARLFQERQVEPGRHVLSVGTLIPSKGHDVAIRAVAAAGSPLPVLVVAPRPAPAEALRLQQLADSLGVVLMVRIGVSDTELAAAYATAVVTMYLARDEPLGMVSLEAQAAGSPVIVAAEGGLPETVDEGRSGWAVPRDAASAARRLTEVCEPGVRDRMSNEAKRHASAYTWVASAEAVSREVEALAPAVGVGAA